MKEQIKQVDWIVKMRNKNICLELKMDRVVYLQQEENTGWWTATDGTGECSAAFALPACHASSTADIYIFTVGLFYRGLSKDIFS